MADRLSGPDVTHVAGLPLMMGDKIVGRASLNYETGKLEADLDKELMVILAEALGANLLQISFYGRPAVRQTVEEAQAKLKEYLDG